MAARFIRLAEKERAPVALTIDGRAVRASEGDTLLVAILIRAGHLAAAEDGDGVRAGFCLMGACQDCWVWTGDGERVRACSTTVVAGMDIRTTRPEETWPTLG